MKQKVIQWLLALWLGFFLPGILLSVMTGRQNTDQTDAATTWQTTGEQVQTQAITQIPVLLEDGSVQQMLLEDYVTRVVLAEMPAYFEAEALKAQAVVARTYTLKRTMAADKHTQGAVCTQSACCQAYRTQESFLQQGGTQQLLDKVAEAVRATAGQVLYYNGALIEATYFSCSGGRTEDAAAVWGEEIPYLQAIDSPGEERSERYTQTVRFPLSEFAQKMGLPESELTGNFLGSMTYTEGGGVAQMLIGSQLFEGTDIRQRLGLNSTAFVITAIGDQVIVTTKGFGHRVGMSQYGAEAMAVQGSSYDRILAHYYQGTQLQTYNG